MRKNFNFLMSLLTINDLREFVWWLITTKFMYPSRIAEWIALYRPQLWHDHNIGERFRFVTPPSPPGIDPDGPAIQGNHRVARLGDMVITRKIK